MRFSPNDFAALLDDTTRAAHGAELDRRVGRFLDLLRRQRAWNLLPRIMESFHTIVLRREGLTEIHLTSARPVAKSDLGAIARNAGLDPEAVRWTTVVDPAVRGGLTIQIGDQVIRGTIDDRIQSLSRQLD